jgi:hypothetical protein
VSVSFSCSNFFLRQSAENLSDVVYSLIDGDIVWRKDYTNETPQHYPLLIGKHRVYLVHQNSSNGYDLAAYEFRTKRFLYKTCIIANSGIDNHGCLSRNRRDVLELIKYDGDELIIQFNSNQSASDEFCTKYFTIIDGANGHMIQQIGYTSFSTCFPKVLSNSTTFAFVGSARGGRGRRSFDMVTVQKYSQQTEKTFSRTTLQVVTLREGTLFAGNLVIHPFTLQGFSFLDSDSAPKALTLDQNGNTDNRREVDTALQYLSPDITVDECYRVVAARPLTLPPRQSNHGSSRREFRVFVGWNCGRILLPDERRLVFHHSHSKDDATYVFDFTPKW